MNNVGRTAGATGAGAAFVSVICFLLSLKGVNVPSEVSADMVILVATGAHYLATFLSSEEDKTVTVTVPAQPVSAEVKPAQ